MIDLKRFREDNDFQCAILSKEQDVAALGFVCTGKEDDEERQIVRIVYDVARLEQLVHDDIPLSKCVDEEDRWDQAVQYVEYNTLGTFPNPDDIMSPIFLHKIEEY
jgi:hypothetical protein